MENPLSVLSPRSISPLPDTPRISLHAMLGHSFSKNLRLKATIFNKDITVLVDGGSTHNFIQDRIAKFLNMPTTQSSKLMF